MRPRRRWLQLPTATSLRPPGPVAKRIARGLLTTAPHSLDATDDVYLYWEAGTANGA